MYPGYLCCGTHSILDLCLEVDSYQPRQSGAEIGVWLGPQYPSNVICLFFALTIKEYPKEVSLKIL